MTNEEQPTYVTDVYITDVNRIAVQYSNGTTIFRRFNDKQSFIQRIQAFLRRLIGAK